MLDYCLQEMPQLLVLECAENGCERISPVTTTKHNKYQPGRQPTATTINNCQHTTSTSSIISASTAILINTTTRQQDCKLQEEGPK
jgi:hypothetical protein